MTTPQKPISQPSQNPDDLDEARIVNPIDIARARHASLHGSSVLNKTRQVPAVAGSATSAKGQSTSNKPASSTASRPISKNKTSLFGSFNSCLLLSFIGTAFVIGGVLGGLVGGGLLLWTSGPEGLALLGAVPTATPLPTPTPAPAATLIPTPTPEPVITPAVEDIIAQIIPSVVTVINRQQHVNAFTPEEGRIVGSGVIVDSYGYIATNNHVIDNAGNLSVILADGREVMAELIAADPSEDLAILKVNLENLPAIKWGDASTVRLGQAVYAIGSPLGDFPNSVSFGIVSGLNRALEMNEHVIAGLIQTDAAINRGSSGGPLINTQGEMIGINTFIIRESEDRGIAEGIAFSIPSTTAKSLLTAWIAAHRGESVPIPASGEPGN